MGPGFRGAMGGVGGAEWDHRAMRVEGHGARGAMGGVCGAGGAVQSSLGPCGLEAGLARPSSMGPGGGRGAWGHTRSGPWGLGAMGGLGGGREGATATSVFSKLSAASETQNQTR